MALRGGGSPELSSQNLKKPSEDTAAGNTKKRVRKQANNLELLAPNIWLVRQLNLHCLLNDMPATALRPLLGPIGPMGPTRPLIPCAAAEAA